MSTIQLRGNKPVPKNHIEYRRSSVSSRFSTAGWLTLLSLTTVCVTSAIAQENPHPTNVAESPAKEPPPLSLESLFHPEQKFDYDGKVPSTHWLDDTSPVLLLRRDDGWKQVDLDSGKESESEVAKKLAENLASLEGVDEKLSVSAANSAIASLKKTSDPVLVRLEKSLAIVSISSPAKRLTQDASKWGNTTLDPTGRRVAYTQDGDLFLVDIATGRSMRLTQDDSDTLLDGVLDWTYQEEIFGRGNFCGFWFSPDGESLAMLRIDTSGVEPYILGSSEAPRGKADTTRYPKAGDPIPHASLVLWNLSRFEQGTVPPPQTIEQSTDTNERIVTGVWWHPHRRRLMYSLSDRVQSWRELRYVDNEFVGDASVQSKLLLREESPTWVEPPAEPGFLSDGGLIWRSELPTGKYRLYRISSDGSSVIPITPEDLSVRDFFVSPNGSFLLLTGDIKTRTVEQHFYRINLPPTGKTSSDAIDLQNLTSTAGWHGVSNSPAGDYFVDVHSDCMTPPTVSLGSTDPASTLSVILHQSKLTLPRKMNAPEFIRITTPDGLDFPGMIVRPKTTQENPKPLAVVIETYGGPQAPVVTNRWPGPQALYRELLARQGIATLVIDNRSSAGRGLVDTWSIHKRFGQIELQDLLTSVEWLKQQPWVDKDRIALRGWSYGGYLTLYALTHSDVFAAGIAGGSVSDFREYDAFYTERYMGLPKDNVDGYLGTDVTAAAGKLHGRLLMIHGEIDDNVHPLGTLRMAKALQLEGKPFDLMLYPGNAHSVHHPKQVWHMVNLTHEFLIESFK